jgi:ubiquitin carboxyl-terminal hydrolase 22/27/51
MDDMFQDFYALENTNGYTAANVLSGFWISEKKAFENLVTTKEQDAHEFFQFLAEELHERNGDGKKPEIGSEHSCNCIIHQTFYGKLQSTTTCQNCSGVTNQVQSFLDLSLPLENLSHKKGKKGVRSLTLQECLDEEYIKSDKCEYRCHNCSSMQQARRHTSIKRLPNVLSIQLKVRLSLSFIHFCSIRKCLRQNSDSSTSKAATSAPRRSTPPCSFRSSSTCSPTRTAPAAKTPRRTTSWPARAPLTCSAWWCTWARSTPATTCRIAGLVIRYAFFPSVWWTCTNTRQWFAFNDHKVELAQKSDVLNSRPYLLFYVVRSLA